MMISTEAIVERFGTPVYIYDLSSARHQLVRLRAAVPAGSKILYSLKANPHPDIVAALVGAGAGADVSSCTELRIALEAGASPSDILVTGPAKSPELIRAVVGLPGATVSIESIEQAETVSRLAEVRSTRVDSLLRINVDDSVHGIGLAFAGRPSQFGIDLAQALDAVPSLMDLKGLNIVGTHCFLGTQIVSRDALVRCFATSASAAAELRRHGLPLNVADLGGGFASPYADFREPYPELDLVPLLEEQLDDRLPGWRDIEVWFESGRYLAGAAGRLVCRVVDVKVSKGERFVVVDSGVHHLGGMSALGRLPPLRARAVVNRATPEPVDEDVTTRLVGELCTSVDCWNPRASLPALEPGDLLEISNVGAYGLTAGLLGFLSHDAPVEVAIEPDGGVRATKLRVERRKVDG